MELHRSASNIDYFPKLETLDCVCVLLSKQSPRGHLVPEFSCVTVTPVLCVQLFSIKSSPHSVVFGTRVNQILLSGSLDPGHWDIAQHKCVAAKGKKYEPNALCDKRLRTTLHLVRSKVTKRLYLWSKAQVELTFVLFSPSQITIFTSSCLWHILHTEPRVTSGSCSPRRR